jgi:acyl-CoA synthetase (AMP-forming)/AMP-acid ligase II
VAVYLPNSVEAVVAIFAILKAAGTFVVVNHTTKRDKLAYILNNCRATAMFTSERNASLATEVHAAVPSLKFTVLSGKRQPKRGTCTRSTIC